MIELATTKTVLHPREVQELKDRKAARESMLAGTGFQGGSPGLQKVITGAIQNQEALVREIREIDGMLERDAPQPIPSEQIDDARRLEAELADSIRQGMPSQEEYRRNTAGAVDRHRAWDSAKKDAVLKWKHLRRRMWATGMSEHGLSDEQDVSNVEKLRPRNVSADLGDAQIPQVRTMFQQPPGSAPVRVMSDAQKGVLQEIAPDIAESMATLPNDIRAEILDRIDALVAAKTLVKKPPSEMAQLRGQAKALGINSYGMSKEKLRAAIEEAQNGISVDLPE